MKKKLITSALPYVNNVPHLGNIIGSVLSADVYARFCRMMKYETLFVCGTDEYGTATEMKALEEKKTPQQVCDHYHAIHKRIYEWFQISFDVFGRTSLPVHAEITQKIFQQCDQNGFMKVQSSDQFYDETAKLFLADRYLVGECPHCHFPEAHGDQCDKCGKLLQPDELLNLKSTISGSQPVKKTTQHLYLDLPQIESRLVEWIHAAQKEGSWTDNAQAITQSWIREGLKTRSITRDLKWGIPVPKPGFEGKVFYVWFDAPIGYISITASRIENWKDWWMNSKEVQLYQFMGKDNVPFHSILFPAIQLASGEPWTMVHHLSATEYLNYEDDKFSKSRGIGVFGTDAIESGVSVDFWRYYLLCMRPEQHDTCFHWSDFQARINNELSANLGNLVHRVLVFAQNKLDSTVPVLGALKAEDQEFLDTTRKLIQDYQRDLEEVRLRDGLSRIMLMAKIANKYLQDTAPWKTIKEDSARTGTIIAVLLITLRNLGVLLKPYLPESAETLFRQLGIPSSNWEDLHHALPAGQKIGTPQPLFHHLEDETVEKLKAQYSGQGSKSVLKPL
ncbi:MAG: methionine--tRNA ligase [Bdellovibrionia bacterium]